MQVIPRERQKQRGRFPLLRFSSVAAACAVFACASTPGDRAADLRVATGADVLNAERFATLRGLRVGLLTNHTGTVVAGTGVRSTIDIMHESPDIELVSLFSPEHGIR